tara:strand:- start:120035 stop:122161 length:2127 start_codon:yes stop_codon:yes gene_type:complete
MKQVLQNLSSGETQLVDLPSIKKKEGSLLIATSRTLVSVGTERMLVDFGKANLIDKARQQPDKVKMVLDKIRTDGLLPTLEAVRSKLDQPIALGYSNVGRVVDTGKTGYYVGQRVVSNGPHADYVCVAKNLCAAVPEEVDDESASFTVVAAIALQGVRLADPTIGESVVVFGLGLIGLLTVQILRANGCRVLGLDYDSRRCELARQFGAEMIQLSQGQDPIYAAQVFSRGRGVDAVLITASTKSNEPVHQAATMCRKRGRIVLVGVVGLELSRADFYEKELSFQVSCSYGPGRYDSEFEKKGHDYPIGFVRWTEQRNFEAVLDLMASGALNIKPLITHRFPIDQAIEAYKLLDDPKVLGLILEYKPDFDRTPLDRVYFSESLPTYKASDVVCAFVGAGNYASRVLIPAFQKAGAHLHTLVSSGGVSGLHHGRKNGFYETSTDLQAVLDDEQVNTVVIATRHNLHAQQVVQALKTGKHVFIEKPLALKSKDLELIDSTWKALGGRSILMVGYNRRFSPFIERMKILIDRVPTPKCFIMTMNAGAIPADHWTQDTEVGGGRIIGEACHYIDLMRFLVGVPISGYSVTMMGIAPGVEVREDKASITLSFEDGSFGTIHYLANGGKAFPKERIEVFAGDAVLQLDNFKNLRGYGWKGFKRMRSISQNKGQMACAKTFVNSIELGIQSPIPYEEIMEVARVTLEIAESLRKQA